MNETPKLDALIYRVAAALALISLVPILFTYGYSVVPGVTGPSFYLRFIATTLSAGGIIIGLILFRSKNRVVPAIAAICALGAAALIIQFMKGIADVAAAHNDAGNFFWFAAFPLPLLILSALLSFKRFQQLRSNEVTKWQR